MPDFPPPRPARSATRVRPAPCALSAALILGFAAGVDAALGTPTFLLVQLPLVLLGGAVLLRALSRSATASERALGREQALRRAGAALVAARGRDGILAAGLAAVPELAGAGSHATITTPDGHRVVTEGEAVERPLRLPLHGSEPQGMLDVEAPAGLDAETRSVLETFADELGMAPSPMAWPPSSRARTRMPGTAACSTTQPT